MEQTNCYDANGARADQMLKRNGTAKPAGKKRGPKPKKKTTAEEASSNDENGMRFIDRHFMKLQSAYLRFFLLNAQ